MSVVVAPAKLGPDVHLLGLELLQRPGGVILAVLRPGRVHVHRAVLSVPPRPLADAVVPRPTHQPHLVRAVAAQAKPASALLLAVALPLVVLCLGALEQHDRPVRDLQTVLRESIPKEEYRYGVLRLQIAEFQNEILVAFRALFWEALVHDAAQSRPPGSQGLHWGAFQAGQAYVREEGGAFSNDEAPHHGPRDPKAAQELRVVLAGSHGGGV